MNDQPAHGHGHDHDHWKRAMARLQVLQRMRDAAQQANRTSMLAAVQKLIDDESQSLQLLLTSVEPEEVRIEQGPQP